MVHESKAHNITLLLSLKNFELYGLALLSNSRFCYVLDISEELWSTQTMQS